MADAVVIATRDPLHTEPAVAFADQGYHMLLEKPMAPTEPACRRIAAKVKAKGIIFAVRHVLRYAHYTRKLKEILRSGRIGKPVSVQHLEPVGCYHQAQHPRKNDPERDTDRSPPLRARRDCSTLLVHGHHPFRTVFPGSESDR